MKKSALLLASILISLLSFSQKSNGKKITRPFLFNDILDKIGSLHDHIVPTESLDYGLQCFADGEYAITENHELSPTESTCKIAIDYFDRAIASGYKSAIMYAEKGFCESFLNLREQAIIDFTTSLNLKNRIPSDLPGDMFAKGEHYEFTDSGYVYKQDGTEYVFYIRPSLVHIYRGGCKQDLKDYRGAVDDYTDAAKWKSNDSNYALFINIGICRLALKQYTLAKTAFNLAINIDKQDGAAYYFRGGVNYNLNLTESACRDWSRAGELGYKKAYEDIKEYCK